MTNQICKCGGSVLHMTSKRHQGGRDRQVRLTRGQRKLHEPSHSRELVRLAKKVREKGEFLAIIEQAQSLVDPYYRAHTLAGIACEMANAKMDDSETVFKSALESIHKIEQQWRRCEILDHVAGRMARAGIKDFFGAIEVAGGLTEERPRKDAIRVLTREMAKAASPDLYRILEICGDEREKVTAIKSILRAQKQSGKMDLHKVADAMKGMKDPYFLVKTHIYVGYTLASMKEPESDRHFQEALEISSRVTDEEKRLELLRHLADSLISTSNFDLEVLIPHADGFSDPAKEANLLSHMAGMLSKGGHSNADDFFERALRSCDRIEKPNVRSSTLRNIATGLSRAGSPKAEEVLAAIEEIESSTTPKEKTQESHIQMEVGGSTGPKEKGCEMEQDHGPRTNGRRLTIGLFNTYEKVLGLPHIRAIARAAPLCWAYDLDLVIIGFPLKDEQEALLKVKMDTAIGKEGKYLGELLNSGRLRLTPDINSQKLGTLVATTSHPDPRKNTRLEDILTNEKHICFVLGVGRLGLPKYVLESSVHHLEFTGKDISFETATAMGILAYMVWKQTCPTDV